jgi:hypothetical protein
MLGKGCTTVTVNRRGRWYVLEGRVDSSATKAKLINSVPEQDGARWVVDRLVVGEITRVH